MLLQFTWLPKCLLLVISNGCEDKMPPVIYYLATDGDDSNPGIQNSHSRLLPKAAQAVLHEIILAIHLFRYK